MSPLFRKSDGKAADDGAGEAELARLTGLSNADLAAEVMPAFGPDGPDGSGGINAVQIAQWLMRSYRRSPGLKPLLGPVQRATPALETGGLVEQRTSGLGTGSSTAKATPLGTQALTDGTVAQHLSTPGG